MLILKLKTRLTALAFAASAAVMLLGAGGVLAADKAADVGGNCCADLEERIAELEATTARKGNRTMHLTISGQVSESLLYISSGGQHQAEIVSNANREAQTLVRFNGWAVVSPGWKMGFTADIGLGGFENGIVFPQNNGMDTNGIYVRQELVYVQSDAFGRLSVGKQELATYGITGYTGGNTGVAHTKMSLAPLVGPPAGSALDIWDGGITNSAKYSTPHWFGTMDKDGVKGGIWIEADWANANDFTTGKSNGDLWDVAIKAMHNFGNFQVGGGVGYRNGMTVDLSGTNLSGFGFSGLNVQDIKVLAGSGYVKEMTTGLFINASYGDTDLTTFIPGSNHLKGWEVQVGDDLHLSHIGATTIFGGYADYDLSGIGLGNANKSYSVGVVQSIDPAAADLFITWQRFDFTSGLNAQADVVMGGARVKF